MHQTIADKKCIHYAITVHFSFITPPLMGRQTPPEMKELARASHMRLLLTKQHRNGPPFDPDPTTDFKHFTVHGLNSHRH